QPAVEKARLPLRAWALDLARRWNGGTYSLLVLHGNIFDLFPIQDGAKVTYVPLKTFLVQRLFPERSCVLFYDISDGLTFGSNDDERMNLVTFLKWAAAPELAQLDVGVILVTESADELSARLLQNPYVAQVRIDLPDADDRLGFLQSGWAEEMADGKAFSDWSDLSPQDLAARTAGLNLLRIRHFLAE